MELELYSALSLGLLGSMHCIGMCGPIALVVPVNRTSKTSLSFGSFIYNAGRVVTYALLGLIFGLIGQTFALAGFQRGVSILLGVIIIVSALLPGLVTRYFNLIPMVAKLTNRLKQSFSELFKQKSYAALFSIGFLNGLLPCGLVYVAIAGALAAGSAWNGSLYMTVFGLGTIPVMFAIPFAGKYISDSLRLKLIKWFPVILFLFGVLFILRGLNIGIPFISPVI